jgi:hypothetical protein
MKRLCMIPSPRKFREFPEIGHWKGLWSCKLGLSQGSPTMQGLRTKVGSSILWPGLGGTYYPLLLTDKLRIWSEMGGGVPRRPSLPNHFLLCTGWLDDVVGCGQGS